MIDCKVSVDKKEDPKGDRVVLTFEYVAALMIHFAHIAILTMLRTAANS